MVGPEIGVHEVILTAAGASDPLLTGSPDRFPVFHWHADTFAIPLGGTLLAVGKPCPNQMFRHESVVGVLFHQEVTLADARAWPAEYRGELEAFGETEQEVMDELAPRVEQMDQLGDAFATNLVDVI
jgi:GMP synthase (glutamine-hydrolysing)